MFLAWLQAQSNGVNTPDLVDPNSHETHHICVSTGETALFYEYATVLPAKSDSDVMFLFTKLSGT